MKANASIRNALKDCEDAVRALQSTAPHARANWQQWHSTGYPNGTGAKGSGISNPVEAIALRDRKGYDPMRDWARFDEKLETARLALRECERLAGAATNVTVTPGAPGCELCDRVMANGRQHPNAWQRIYNRAAPSGTELPDLPRCRWHYDKAAEYGVDMSDRVALYHLDFRTKVPARLIKEEHPEAYTRATGQRKAS